MRNIISFCTEDLNGLKLVNDTIGHSAGDKLLQGFARLLADAAGDDGRAYRQGGAHFGTMIQMEVGAMLVGKIENRPGSGTVTRGQERGNFAFGGSTVIIMTQKKKAVPEWMGRW